MERNRRPLARYATTRAVGIAALGGLAALGIAALDAGPAGASTTTPKAPAVTTTVTFTVALQIALPKDYGIDLHGHGQADFAHRSLTVSLDLPSVGLHSSDIGPGASSLDHPMTLQAEWVDGMAYLKVPDSLSDLAGGAQDLSYAAPAASVHKVDTALAQSAVAITYAQLLLSTLAAHKTEHHMGTRSIDGTEATGTEVDLTLAQLLKVIPGLSPAMDSDISEMADTEIPATVWADHQGRLVEVTMAPPVDATQGSITGSVSFTGYDEAATIAAPPPAAVKPISKSMLSLLRAEDPFSTTH